MISRLYGSIVQNIVFPAMLLPTRSQSTKLAREMRRRQRWPIDRLRELQFKKLKHLVQIAEQDSAFYRHRFLEVGVSAAMLSELKDFAAFPVTTKMDIESNFPDGMVVAEKRNADWQYVGTRGTTHRVMVVQDFERRDTGRAGGMLAMTEDSPYYYGSLEVTIPPDACSVHCGIESNRERSVTRQLWSLASGRIPWKRESVSDLRGLVMENWIRRSISLPPLALDQGDAVLRSCVATLRRLRPMQLTALPEYLHALAEYILRTKDAPPPIPVIRPMGANMPASWKSDVAAAFRGQVREHYGSREMGPMAFDCCHADGLHLLMDRHLIEVVRNGQQVKPGEIGQVLVTDLDNLAMPILRYQIGDLARIDDSPCRCGRNTPRIHLEGRLDDAFVTENDRILTAEAVANFFAGQPGVRDFQLTEDRQGRWNLKIVAKPDYPIDAQAVGKRFLEWAGEPDSRPMQTRLTDWIRPEASGKFRHCKSSSFDRLLQQFATI